VLKPWQNAVNGVEPKLEKVIWSDNIEKEVWADLQVGHPDATTAELDQMVRVFAKEVAAGNVGAVRKDDKVCFYLTEVGVRDKERAKKWKESRR
jgi:hypothetical protein